MKDEYTFKSTYEILKEISKVYDGLTDAKRADIAEMLGGKVGLNTVQAILSNFETAEKVVDELGEGLAEGSASKELEASLDSINGKLNQLKSTWQELSTDVVDSDAVKFVVDGLRTILKIIDDIAKLTNGGGLVALLGLTGFQAVNGAGRAKLFALDRYARESSGGNTERVDTIIVVSARELWKNYRTWCITQ
jgi:TP901 family phage tail tape measure protein